MKKSLIALAVLAASGAAMAQSSVTVYGRVDASIGSIDTGAGSDSKLFSGGTAGLTTPRLGFMGKEDLGGGLAATFKLEQRIDLDTGAQQPTKDFTNTDTPGFKAETSVGLAGGFGAVRLGRMTTSFDDVRALSNKFNVFDSNGFTTTGFAFENFGSKLLKYTSRNNGMVRYDSPSFGGVYASASYAFDQRSDVADDQTVTSLHLGYKAGGLNVAFGYQDEKTKFENTALAASYDFGAFALSGGFQSAKADTGNNKETGYNIGVEVPIGDVKVSLGYASAENKLNGAKVSDASGFGLGAKYALSKRTSLYGGYSTAEVEGAVNKEQKLFAIGVRHDF